MVFSLVYVSHAVEPFSRDQLLALLNQCRTNNARSGVSGMLLYRNGKIIQLLEGDEDVVRGLFARVETDPRHEDVVNVWSGYGDDRQYPDWTMGFTDLTGVPIEDEGYSDLLSEHLTAYELTHTANLGQELLQMFRKFS